MPQSSRSFKRTELLASAPKETAMRYLKIAFGIIAVLAILAGIIWIFQGLNVLPGSFMTGDINWTYRGAALAVAGALLLWGATRKPHAKP
jgi:hypothetical protein